MNQDVPQRSFVRAAAVFLGLALMAAACTPAPATSPAPLTTAPAASASVPPAAAVPSAAASLSPSAAPSPSLVPSPSASAASGPLVNLPIVYDNLSIGAAPVWVMQDAGIFRKYGLNVTADFVQGTAATNALVAGQYDVGFAGASSVVAVDAQDPSLKLVALVFPKLIYSLVSAKSITTPDQLRGKTFGISTLGDSSDTATRLIVRALGLDPQNDIQVLQVGNSPARYAALVTGNIDAVIADPMDVVRARRDGFNVLADPSSLGIDYSSGAFVMREAFLRDHPDVAKHVLEAVVDGMHYYKTHQGQVAQIAGQHLQSTDTDALQQAVATFSDMTPETPLFTESSLDPVLQDAARQIPSLQGATMAPFVDNSIVQDLQQSGFVDQIYGSS